MNGISETSLANDRGEFWEGVVRQLRGENDNIATIYQNKEEFMTMVYTWFEEPDVGMASIAWDLVDMERGLVDL